MRYLLEVLLNFLHTFLAQVAFVENIRGGGIVVVG